MSEDSLINIKINNKEIQVDKNLTVMQACEIAGEEIPRFCYQLLFYFLGIEIYQTRNTLPDLEDHTLHLDHKLDNPEDG